MARLVGRARPLADGAGRPADPDGTQLAKDPASADAPRYARRLLAIEASGKACSVAVWAEGELRAHSREAMERGQSERLAPMLGATMAAAGLGFDALDAVAVTLGPGGFTGVRIGLAAAEGVALAWRLPIVGISGFELLAAALPAERRAGRALLTLIDAKRPELYAAAFDRADAPLLAPCLIAPAALAARLAPAPAGGFLLAGDASGQGLPALRAGGLEVEASGITALDAGLLAALAAARALPATRRPPQPLYLRPPDTTRPKARGPGAR